ncbi:MAG: SDR family oxidoreductase [Oxalobacter sp.]|nr:MAG: SDR family oxidoreductase [Oxalobacter sp.]
MLERFSLQGRVVVVTGGAGLLGRKHAEAVAQAGGIPVLLDIHQDSLDAAVMAIKDEYGVESLGLMCNITEKQNIEACLATVLKTYGRVDALVNNAANDPKVGSSIDAQKLTRFENLSADFWHADMAVGLTGAFFCSQVFGHYMATHGGGVIVNVASDLAVIAPDQRLYEVPGLQRNEQPVKPATYSVVKAGLVGLTRYLATYWAEVGVRVNAISPGGVFNGQSEEFVGKLAQRIPMGRMANQDEYEGTLLYLLSDASSYLTGFNLVVDGGRSCW